MKFSEPCLIFILEDNAIDWAVLAEPGEEWTVNTIAEYCDKPINNTIYAYPLIGDAKVSDTLDTLDNALATYMPQRIPGVFTL